MPRVQATKPKLHFYTTYRFRETEKDPIIDRVRTLMEDTGTSTMNLSRGSNLSPTTVYNWLDGPTRRPQYASICAAIRAMGYDFAIVPAKRQGNGKGWPATEPKIITRFKTN